jgi:hypothetical protein
MIAGGLATTGASSEAARRGRSSGESDPVGDMRQSMIGSAWKYL